MRCSFRKGSPTQHNLRLPHDQLDRYRRRGPLSELRHDRSVSDDDEKQLGSQSIRMALIFNSFSRCPEMPNKFRVIMFYKQPAHSIPEHRAVYDKLFGD
jgi:hypothetical protein